MPFQQLVGNTRVRVQRIDDSLYASRDNGTRIVDAVAHRIAGADFDRNLIFLHQLHQLQAKRNNISVNIGPRDILQMASGADSLFQALLDDAQVMLHCLFAGHFQFHENVIIGTADQNTGFLHADLFHQLEVLLARANPAGNFGKFISFFQTFVHCIPIFFTVKEKFAGADQTIFSAQSVQIVINRYNLFGGIRGA